ncbi:PPOX class F420-dependent oxidoreductase [uncultured Jatrophihabitans sp.]|uniref:PPOX class F420-dependent oxidoreductase n=1 Tax=uncultured Jatrophihabitans sp. TaxID=1610747 RepID=UPI0035CC3CEF
MTADERGAFLLGGTRTGILSTVRADGRPHAVPVWFVLDGDDVLFMTGGDTVKGRNLRRTGQAVLTVDDGRPPYAFVTVTGRVELSDDVAAMLPWSIAMGERYMGADKAEEFGRRNAVPGELLVRIVPDRIVAMAAVAD